MVSWSRHIYFADRWVTIYQYGWGEKTSNSFHHQTQKLHLLISHTVIVSELAITWGLNHKQTTPIVQKQRFHNKQMEIATKTNIHTQVTKNHFAETHITWVQYDNLV